jgi:pyruvate carboxylase
MYHEVNKWCGDVVKVTPSSKSVGDIALFLIKQGITVEDLSDAEKLKALSWPTSAIEFARGEMGFPHHGFPKVMQDAILKGQISPMVGRPGDTLPAEDFAKIKREMEEEFKRPATDEDMNAFLMYPGVFRGYMKHIDKYGPLVTCLPSPAFFYGLEVGEQIEFEVPGTTARDGEEKSDPSLPKSVVRIELVRVGPLDGEDVRAVEWMCDGLKYVVKMKDPSATGRAVYAGPMADLNNSSHVACPLPGVVGTLKASPGQQLKKDDVICIVVAMKMEVVVRAPADCTITDVCVTKDQEVVDSALLVKIKLSE